MCGTDPRDQQVEELENERDTALSVVEDLTAQISTLQYEKGELEREVRVKEALYQNVANMAVDYQAQVKALSNVVYLATVLITDPIISEQVRQLGNLARMREE